MSITFRDWLLYSNTLWTLWCMWIRRSHCANHTCLRSESCDASWGVPARSPIPRCYRWDSWTSKNILNKRCCSYRPLRYRITKNCWSDLGGKKKSSLHQFLYILNIYYIAVHEKMLGENCIVRAPYAIRVESTYVWCSFHELFCCYGHCLGFLPARLQRPVLAWLRTGRAFAQSTWILAVFTWK